MTPAKYRCDSIIQRSNLYKIKVALSAKSVNRGLVTHILAACNLPEMWGLEYIFCWINIWRQDRMAAILQMKFSNWFSRIKLAVFCKSNFTEICSQVSNYNHPSVQIRVWHLQVFFSPFIKSDNHMLQFTWYLSFFPSQKGHTSMA